MISILFALFACDGDSKDDSSGGGDDGGGDDSAVDDSGTGKGDDSATNDDSGTECKVDWYQDGDGDGYGGGTPTSACDAPGTDWLQTGGDCDDSRSDVNPAATEICNDIDDDCDLDIDDEDEGVEALTWYPDGDGDGYPDTSGTPVLACASPGAYALEDAKHPADCNDADGSVYPGAPELCDDVPQGCVAKDWKGDVGVATWYPASGGSPQDWTADLAAGKYGATTKIVLLDEGELVLCDGVWYAQLVVGDASTFTGPSNVAITGLHGSGVTTLSGGDYSAILRVAAHDVSVTAQGLTLTEGNAPYGAAISTGALMGGGSISWSIDIGMTLRDVRIVDNMPTDPIADAAVEFNNGILTLEDSTIANNSVYGIYGDGVDLYCSGDPKNDAGIWGNYSVNVRVSTFGSDPLLIESDGCDFDGTSPKYTTDYDVLLYNAKEKAVYNYGDDADFLCDVSTVTCSK